MFFRDQYAFLSNFYQCKLVYKGLVYNSAEHLYQACKAITDEDREYVRTAPTSAIAKQRGSQIQLRSNWNKIKVNAMRGVLELKFSQHPDLRIKLSHIREEIVEENSWNDTFWGKCRDKGENHLGLLLMEIRDKFRKEYEQACTEFMV